MLGIRFGILAAIFLPLAAGAAAGDPMAGSIRELRAAEVRSAQVAQASSTAAKENATASSKRPPPVKPHLDAQPAKSRDKKVMTIKKGPMGEMAEIPTDVMFKFNSSELRPNAVNVLAECAEMIRRDGNKNMRVIGHTDSVGPASYNLGLSKRRAEAVTAWLVNQGGIPKEDLTAVGVGDSKSKATNATAKGRAQNRRVEVVMPMGGSPHQPMSEEKK
jgi:outer membrane protein OmpA-like peptidoglycan-associated protein